MVKIDSIRVYAADGAYLYTKYKVTGDNAATDFSGNRVINAGAPIDLSMMPGDDTVNAGGGNDTVNGGDGNDTINGENGDDKLQGAAGDDTLNGGAGNDLVQGGDGNDRIVQNLATGNDTIDGGAGMDVADYSALDGLDIEGITFNLAAGTVKMYQHHIAIRTDTILNVETVVGSRYDDRISGTARAELFSGEAGNDLLIGGDGNDTLNGGTGTDMLLGANGDDVLIQTQLIGGDWLFGGADFDVADYSQLEGVGSSITIASGRTVYKRQGGKTIATDTLDTMEKVIGTRNNDAMTGSAHVEIYHAGDGHDSLYGGDGNDSLYGGSGNDLLIGQAGDDTIFQDSLQTNETIDGGSGIDTLDYSEGTAPGFTITVNLAAGTVTKYLNDVVIGIDTVRNVETFKGARHTKLLSGTDAGDDLRGQDGPDTIDGGAGNDTLHGAAGNDVLNGGTGNDVISGDAGNDTLSGGGSDAIRGGDGDDVVVVLAFAGNSTIDGGAGNDILDYSQFIADGARVVIDYTSNTVTKYQDDVVVGMDTFLNFEQVIGSRFDDTIIFDFAISDAPDNPETAQLIAILIGESLDSAVS